MVALTVVIAIQTWIILALFHNRLLLLLFQPVWKNWIRILVLALTDCYSSALRCIQKARLLLKDKITHYIHKNNQSTNF